MAVSIGGIQIGVGIDISSLLDGFNAAKDNIETFRKDIAKIRVEGLVKGDPFSTTRKHLSKTREAINDVFKSWTEAMKYTTKDINKFTALSKKSTEKIMRDWAKLGGSKRISLATGLTFESLKGMSGIGLVAGKKPRAMADWFDKSGEAALKKYINMWGGAVPELRKSLYKFSKAFISGTKITKTEAEAQLRGLYDILLKGRQKVVNEYKRFGEDLRKAQLRQTRIEWVAKGAEARSPEALMKRRREELLKLTVAYRRYYLEREKGYNVEAMNEAIGKNLLARQRWGAKLTKEQTKELKRYNKELAKQRAGEQLFSRQWLMNRARWFIQLRLFWSVYRNTLTAIKDLVDYEYQLARAMRTAHSQTKSNVVVTKLYSDAMQEAVSTHGVGWKDVGEALYQLGSAGLTAEESLAALNSTMSLIVGTEGDTRDVTKAVAGVYNNFADTITHVTTLQEKFAYINNVIATAWKHHQIEIEELTMGYKRASMMADKVGVDFKELTALLAVLNDHMIKGGRAGRSLVSVWSRLSRATKEFSEEFGVVVKGTEPLDFMKIMDQLSKKMRKGETSAYALAAAFRRMGLRGAPTFVTLIKRWDEVSEAMRELSDEMDAAAKLEDILLDTMSGRWKQLVGEIKAYISEWKGLQDVVKNFFKSIRETIKKDREKEKLGGLLERYVLGPKPFMAGIRLKMTNEELTFLKKQYKELTEYLSVEDNKVAAKRYNAVKKYYDKLWILMQGIAEAESKGWTPVETKEEELSKKRKEKQKEELLDDEKRLNVKRKEFDITQRIQWATELIAQGTKNIAAVEKIKRKTRRKDVEDVATVVALNKELEALVNKRIQDENTLKRLIKEKNKPLLEAYNLDIKSSRAAISELTSERAKLKLKDAIKNREAIAQKTTEIAHHEKHIAFVQLQINNLTKKENKELAERLFAISVEAATAKELTETEENRLKYIAESKRQQTIETNRLLIAKDREISLAKIRNADAIEILKLEKDRLDIRLKDLDIVEELVKKDADAVDRIHNKRRQIEIEITENREKQKRAMHPLYDAYKKIEASVKSVNEFISDITVQTSRGIAGGLTDIVYDLTGGFQEQQQEAENLKGRLAELNKEYNNLFEEDEGRAKEITEEMARLRKEIDDLEDPIHNLKEAFKDFFKDLIDQIRKAIIQWIALRAVQAGMSWAGFNIGGNAGGVSPGDLGYANWGGWTLPKKTGGVLPEIKAFKQFSSGGITSRPTLLALAGDNKSGRELIIPEENIKSDEVSGYVRESGQPINIVNVLTREDIAMAMAGTEGEQVIINTIGRDLQNRGPIFRQLGGK